MRAVVCLRREREHAPVARRTGVGRPLHQAPAAFGEFALGARADGAGHQQGAPRAVAHRGHVEPAAYLRRPGQPVHGQRQHEFAVGGFVGQQGALRHERAAARLLAQRVQHQPQPVHHEARLGLVAGHQRGFQQCLAAAGGRQLHVQVGELHLHRRRVGTIGEEAAQQAFVGAVRGQDGVVARAQLFGRLLQHQPVDLDGARQHFAGRPAQQRQRLARGQPAGGFRPGQAVQARHDQRVARVRVHGHAFGQGAARGRQSQLLLGQAAQFAAAALPETALGRRGVVAGLAQRAFGIVVG